MGHISLKTCVLGAQKNCLNETVLLSTHNICFGWEIRKIIFKYALLSGGLIYFFFWWGGGGTNHRIFHTITCGRSVDKWKKPENSSLDHRLQTFAKRKMQKPKSQLSLRPAKHSGRIEPVRIRSNQWDINFRKIDWSLKKRRKQRVHTNLMTE